ncbi:MAG: hypothetical protein HPY57_14845 [Ignavibacteria bacterium]|nr:hypothetical protein [Ignavibacteria bacterium]
MNLFTPLKIEQLLDGDIVKIDFINHRKLISKSNYNNIEYSERIEHSVYKDRKFYSVIDNQELVLENLVKYPYVRIYFYLHNYKFVAKKILGI